MYTNNVLAPRLQHTNIITYADGALFSTLSAEKFNLGIYNTDSNYSLAISGNSLFYHNVTISGTLSANNVYFTSITSVQISISSQELNFLGSVSITGDEVIPIAQHLFQIYKPSNTTIPIFYVSSAGLIGVDTKFPTSKLSISGDIDLSGNYKYYGITGISSPNYNNNLSQITTSGGIVTGITNIAISSITAGIDFSAYTTTALFVSTTSLLNTNINSLSSYVGNLERFTTTGLFLTITSDLSNAINSNSAAIISLSSSLSTLSSNFISVSSSIGNLNRFTLTSDFVSATASLTGATLLSKTGTQVYLTTPSNNLRLGNATSLTGMKLDVQGTSNFGNTVSLGVLGEKGGLTWGGVPQSLNLFTTTSINVAIKTSAGEMLTVASGGNVGINTSTPNKRLAVNGAVSITGALTTTGGMASLTGGINVRGDGTNAPITIYAGAGGQIFSIRNNGIWDVGAGTLDFTSGYAFNTSNTQRLAVQSNGNIAVGNITATERLSISGNTSISGGLIKAQQSNHSVTANIFQSGQSVTYQKGSNYVIAFNDAGTIKYRYLVLTGTDAVWNYSTVAP